MSSQRDDDDDTRPVVWAVLIGAIVLAVGLALGIGISKSMKARNHASAAPAVVAGAVVVQTLQLRDDESRVVVEGQVVKFYFASGKAELAEGADLALVSVIQGVAAGKRAIISGFHDTTGSAAVNEELSKERAVAVRAALLRLNVGEDKVDLRKPAETTATGGNAEARRVEVTLE